MSLDQQAKTGYQPPGPPRPGRGRAVLLVVGVLAAVVVVAGLVGAVASDRDTGVLTQTPPSPSTPDIGTVTPTVPAAEVERQQILAQYQRFNQVLDRLPGVPAVDRPTMLAPVAVEPLFSSTLRGLAELDSRGETPYGNGVLNPEIVSVEGGTAVVRDCQDNSRGGSQKADGTKVTVGGAGDLATVTMLRGDDGVWRASTLGYANEDCA
jgi:hypothetical protein